MTFQLWESAEARQRNAVCAVHAQALVDSGIQARVRGSRPRMFARLYCNILLRGWRR